MTQGEKLHKNFEGNKAFDKEVLFVEANYSLLSDNFRRHAPSVIQCSIFCGGRQCRYENPNFWDSTHMAVNGIYSHWVTDDILAMARPCTDVIKKKNVIEQFKSLGVKSLINLQKPGEHANCGYKLEKTGFTYDPAVFMENNIYYYNFGWNDYGETPLTRILDMVKIISFGLTEGKVAIHCHAGLGRTGVLISCYLVYKMKFKANKAIMFVRLKRPNSVQTRGQIQCVQEFEQMVWSQTLTFFIKEQAKEKKLEDFTLSEYLSMQKIVLHGREARYFRNIPKIIFIICEKLLNLSNRQPVGTVNCTTDDAVDHTVPTVAGFIAADNNVSFYQYIFAKRIFSNKRLKIQHHPSDIATTSESVCCRDESVNENNRFGINISTSLSDNSDPEVIGEDNKVYNVEDVVNAFTVDHFLIHEKLKKRIRQYQQDLNKQSWKKLEKETNLIVLTGLLFEWLEQLRSPILTRDDITVIVLNYPRPQDCLKKFDLVCQYTVEYLFRFVAHLSAENAEHSIELIKRLLASLTHQTVNIRGNIVPAEKEFNRLRAGTFRALMEFSTRLLDIVYENIKEEQFGQSDT